MRPYYTDFENKKEIDILDLEMQKAAEDLDKQAEAIKIMTTTPGWSVIEKYFEKTIKAKREKLDYIDLTSNEALRLQAEILAMKSLLSFVK